MTSGNYPFRASFRLDITLPYDMDVQCLCHAHVPSRLPGVVAATERFCSDWYSRDVGCIFHTPSPAITDSTPLMRHEQTAPSSSVVWV